MAQLPQPLRALPLPELRRGLAGAVDPETGRLIGQLVKLTSGCNRRQGIDLVVGSDGKPLSVEYERTVWVDEPYSMYEIKQWQAAWVAERDDAMLWGRFEGELHAMERRVGWRWWLPESVLIDLLATRMKYALVRDRVHHGEPVPPSGPPPRGRFATWSRSVVPSVVIEWRPDVARRDPISGKLVTWRWADQAFDGIPDQCRPGFYEERFRNSYDDGYRVAAHLAMACEAWLRLDDAEAETIDVQWRAPWVEGGIESVKGWSGPAADDWYSDHAANWYAGSTAQPFGLPCSECPYVKRDSMKALCVVPP